MPSDLYTPRGSHPEPPAGTSRHLFRSTDHPGYLIGDIAITDGGDVYEWDGDSWNVISIAGGGGGSSEPPVQHVIGSGDPTGPESYEAVAYNDDGKIWLNVSSTWQLRFN